jgi:hypothetical protein
MTRTTTRMMIAAAALAVAAGVASAQSMKAEIPFAFRFGNELYPAGTYSVEVQNANTMVYLINREARRSGILVPLPAADPSKEWRTSGAPMLAFECGLGRCQLTQVWAGTDHPVLPIPHRRLGPGEVATVRLVHLTRYGD